MKIVFLSLMTICAFANSVHAGLVTIDFEDQGISPGDFAGAVSQPLTSNGFNFTYSPEPFCTYQMMVIHSS